MNDAHDDVAFIEALEHGPPAPLSVYRRAYATAGIEWPGDAEVLRRHPVLADDHDGADEQPPTTVHLMTHQ